MNTIVSCLSMTTFGGMAGVFPKETMAGGGRWGDAEGALGANFPSGGIAQGKMTEISGGTAVGPGGFMVFSGKTGVAGGNRGTRFGSTAVADWNMTTRRRCGRAVIVRIGSRLVGARLAVPDLVTVAGCARLAAGNLMTGERCAALAEQGRVIGGRCARLAAGNLAPILTTTALAEEDLMTHFGISSRLEGLRGQILRPGAAVAGGMVAILPRRGA